MEYNSERRLLAIPEYGRHIHKMIDFVKSIEDHEERNKGAKAVIEIMGRLNPHLRDIEDFRHKLWDHFFIIAGFDIDVDSPYPIPAKESFEEKPELVSYPSKEFKFEHYGNIIEKLVAEVSNYEDGEQKEAITIMLANMMKKSYLNWNRNTVKDELIAKQLEELSGGKLKLEAETELRSTQAILKNSNGRRKGRVNNQKNQKKNNKQRKRY